MSRTSSDRLSPEEHVNPEQPWCSPSVASSSERGTGVSVVMTRRSNASSDPAVEFCGYPPVLAMIRSWNVLYLLFLPLFLCVLCVGLRRRRRSHSDVFTLHIVGLELLTTLGSLIYSVRRDSGGLRLGSSLYSVGIVGQMLVHALTCLERYLAVVRPVVYLRLKERGGVALRNASVAAMWLFSFGIIFLRYGVPLHREFVYSILSQFTCTCFVALAVAACSASVLRALLRPGPGDQRRGDGAKRRAFRTMAAILAVLIVRLIYFIVTYLLWILDALDPRISCAVMVSTGFFTFPSSLILPLLFLQRAGALRRAAALYAWRRRG